MAKPFLKWAGGKRQLISEIEKRLPSNIEEFETYVEPFIGGGALLFHMLENYEFEQVYISDINPELVLCYKQLQSSVKDVIKSLKEIATCADWELAGGYTTIDGKRVRDEGLLEHFELSLSEAQQLIMKAREMLGWVTKEESEEIIKSLVK